MPTDTIQEPNQPQLDSFDKAFKELTRLKQTIAKYDYAYYAMDNPLVSDTEYDQLYQALLKIVKKTP